MRRFLSEMRERCDEGGVWSLGRSVVAWVEWFELVGGVEFERGGAREQRESVSINFYECLDNLNQTFYPFF